MRVGRHELSKFRLVFGPLARRAAHRAIEGRNRVRGDLTRGRFTALEVDRILAETWREYRRIETRIPHEPTRGARLWLRNGALTIAAFRTLRAHGVDREYAIELLGDAAWFVYRRLMALPDAWARLWSRDPVRRIRIDVDVIMKRFPFNPPSYEVSWVPHERGREFHVIRCPYAELMHAELAERDAVDLCEGTACHLDWAAAEAWGGHLERTGTLVSGASRCDFRYLAGDTDPDPRSVSSPDALRGHESAKPASLPPRDRSGPPATGPSS